MRKRTKPSIESFGPELMSALLAGSLKEVRLEMSYRLAIQFRRRIHVLRTRMREEGHEKLKLAEKARVSVLWGEEAGLEEPKYRRTLQGNKVPEDLNAPAIVLIKPYDAEFAAALKKAGIDVDTNVGSDLKIPESETYDPLASFIPSNEAPEGD